MIDPKELQRLGLSEREAKVYIALVNHGPALAKQLPAITAIAHGKIYEILRRLQHRGLLTECTINRKKHFEAARPDDAVQTLLMEQGREFELSRQIGARLEAQMMSIYGDVRGTPSAQSYFTFLQNPAQIVRTVAELQAAAQQETLWFMKGPYAAKYEEPSENDLEMTSLRRGVQYRGIYESGGLHPQADIVQRHILPRVQAGEEARVCPKLNIKLAIFDNRFTLFQFVDIHGPEHPTSVRVDNEGVAMCFAACFEYYWQKSIPFFEFLDSLPSEPESERSNEP